MCVLYTDKTDGWIDTDIHEVASLLKRNNLIFMLFIREQIMPAMDEGIYWKIK